MRQKIGTALDGDLLQRAKVHAAQEGKALNELLEDALKVYLSRRSGASPKRVVEESWGVVKMTPKELRKALQVEIFET
ncbi:MAG TPA: hypothetical protein VJO34_17035 [Methylomirabilota bacterium]|nr:hypothetical protein [Methylomirabilota bacterium]